MANELTGGCGCGAIRYRLLEAPFDAGWCHCRTCQLAAGAPALAFATVHRDHFRVESGEASLRSFTSSASGRRQFCADCGTALTILVDHQPDTIDFTLASLDDPGALSPDFHLFYASRIPWAEAGDTLPRHDRLRPDTVGLPPGQTEL